MLGRVLTTRRPCRLLRPPTGPTRCRLQTSWQGSVVSSRNTSTTLCPAICAAMCMRLAPHRQLRRDTPTTARPRTPPDTDPRRSLSPMSRPGQGLVARVAARIWEALAGSRLRTWGRRHTVPADLCTQTQRHTLPAREWDHSFIATQLPGSDLEAPSLGRITTTLRAGRLSSGRLLNNPSFSLGFYLVLFFFVHFLFIFLIIPRASCSPFFPQTSRIMSVRLRRLLTISPSSKSQGRICDH